MHEFQWKKNIIDNAAITCMTIIVLLLIAAVYKLIIFKLNPNLCIATSIKVYTCSMNLSRGGGGGGRGWGWGWENFTMGSPKKYHFTYPPNPGGWVQLYRLCLLLPDFSDMGSAKIGVT